MTEDTVIRYKNVHLGDHVSLEAFVVLGKPPRDTKDGELETRIGDDSIIRSHTVIYAGTVIGNNFQCGHQVAIREHTTIGNDVSVGTGTVVEHRVVIKNGVRLHSQVFVPEFTILHEGCWLGPNVVITNAKYPRSPMSKRFECRLLVQWYRIVNTRSNFSICQEGLKIITGITFDHVQMVHVLVSGGQSWCLDTFNISQEASV